MSKMRFPIRSFAWVPALVVLCFETQAAHTLRSPDGRIVLSVEMPAAGVKDQPRWSATFQGKPILKACGLGLQTASAGELLEAARLIDTRQRVVDETVPVLFGKAELAKDSYRELRFIFETSAKQRVDVLFRCYNDAVAFRYELPAGAAKSNVVITNETTSFHFENNPAAYVQYLEHFKTSHEHNVTPTTYAQIRRGQLLDLPLTLAWDDGIHAAVTEAGLRQYAGMALRRAADPSRGEHLFCELTPRPDGSKVVRPLPLRTPWRVVLMADRLGALLESQTIYCLNDPPALKDTSWIKPGKLTFHWWNGDVYDGTPGSPMLSFEMAKKYIDFCARSGIPINTFSSTEGTTTPWYKQSKPGVAPGPDTDVTVPREGFDLPAIRAYARSKGVRLWTWVHQAALRGRVEEAFAAFEKLGWEGMMVDFFDHDDQETVEFSEAILEAAARHHILIHFHGVWKPTGVQRTYPNLMNHEAALNLEYLKWTNRCTPEHSLMLAFTRLIAGPMDYHLGGFRAVPRSAFKPHHVAPNVLGTRGHMLGMYVCFDNPTPMVADYPTAYENQPGFDFLVQVPTWWDETRVLAAQIGEVLVVARRKGPEWYVGAISAKSPRDLELPLSFLGPGRYTAKIWKDAADTGTDPNHLSTETFEISNASALKVHVAPDGGFVVKLTQVK